MGPTTKQPVVARSQSVPAQVEEIADNTVYRQKPLRLASGFELAHLAFPLSGRLMRDFSPVVGVAPGVVHDRWHHTPVRGPVASELVGDQPSRFAPLPLQQLAKEPLGRARIAMPLNEDVDYISAWSTARQR